jgi:hypothetical protein
MRLTTILVNSTMFDEIMLNPMLDDWLVVTGTMEF